MDIMSSLIQARGLKPKPETIITKHGIWDRYLHLYSEKVYKELGYNLLQLETFFGHSSPVHPLQFTSEVLAPFIKECAKLIIDLFDLLWWCVILVITVTPQSQGRPSGCSHALLVSYQYVCVCVSTGFLVSSQTPAVLSSRPASKKSGGSSKNLGGKSPGHRYGFKKQDGEFEYIDTFLTFQCCVLIPNNRWIKRKGIIMRQMKKHSM